MIMHGGKALKVRGSVSGFVAVFLLAFVSVLMPGRSEAEVLVCQSNGAGGCVDNIGFIVAPQMLTISIAAVLICRGADPYPTTDAECESNGGSRSYQQYADIESGDLVYNAQNIYGWFSSWEVPETFTFFTGGGLGGGGGSGGSGGGGSLPPDLSIEDAGLILTAALLLWGAAWAAAEITNSVRDNAS